jgi:hypothetical protein
LPDSNDNNQSNGGLREQDFESRLRSLDVTLFAHVPSQTGPHDRASLLALHNACRVAYESFHYVEIGSHLGGSLQVMIADPRCTAITSIDPRPVAVPDARGVSSEYPGNSVERMLNHLRRVPGADLTKLRTIEATTSEISAAAVDRAELCFIDAEHTHDAALRDARFCSQVVAGNGAIVFHDRGLLWSAIEQFCTELEPGSFIYYPMRGSIFVVELGPERLGRTEWVTRQRRELGRKFGSPRTHA